ncbi:MAG TPA: hypothetical protein P5159_02310 [Phycisphaerae bacterium]|nr:hypothetical protein [Phycisphaerae bacterium]HSA25336.1 hypothetical protein [Phycisphaerae bacterium]
MRQYLKPTMLVWVIPAMCSTVGWGATTVLKDHVTDPAAWDDDGGGILDHFVDPDPGWSGVAGIAITGNGQQLSKVGVIWAHASVMGEPNGGDIQELRWRFRFFLDTASFSLADMYSPAPNPNWEAVFDVPSNAGWTNVIGSFLSSFNLRYAEVDVSSLHIATVPGQTHLVVLVPESRLASPATISSIAMSAGGGTTIGTEFDWYERGEYLGAEGPGSLASMGENWSYVAGKVTTRTYARADFDQDGDVDADDLEMFEDCATGPAVPYNPAVLPEPEPGCTLTPDGNGQIAADFDADIDVDQSDFGIFQRCFSGANNPADLDCGDPLQSSLQSAADEAARTAVDSLNCSGSGWALSLQASLGVLASRSAPNTSGLSTSLAVNPALAEVVDDASTLDNTWDKLLAWNYATSGRTGQDADKNLIVRIQRGRCYRDDAGEVVFESLEHDPATYTGWVTANPNIPPFVAANAMLVELERPAVPAWPPGSGTVPVKATALAIAGPVEEVMVAPFAIPVCSLLDEYGEFQGPRMAVTERIFTQAARYCGGEGPNCNNMPTFPYTPCSEVYKDLDDEYLWEEGDEQLRVGQFGDNYFRNFFTGTFDDPNAPGYFAYHRMMMGPYWRGEGSYPLHHDDEVYDGGLDRKLPLAGWFPPHTIEEPYGEYIDGLFGKTEVMASDHAALVGLPAGSAGGGVDQAAVLSILGGGGPGTVAARIGEVFHPLGSGLTSGEDEVWNRIVGAFGPGAQASNPEYGSTELGTIENNYIELTVRSYSTQELWGHARTHTGIDADRDGVIGGPPDQPTNDWASGRYIWDRGLCSSRRVKLQCATTGVDHMCSSSGARADVVYGQSALDTGDLVQWWYDNELAGYWVDIDGNDVEAPDAVERLSTWWDLEPTNQCPECVEPECWDFDDPECYDEWMTYFECLDACVPADPHLFDKIDYADTIKAFWDSKGVLGRLFVVPAEGVDDETPVWKVKVPVIGVRGPAGTCCQDVDGAFDADPGPMSDWDPVVDPSAAWEIIGFVDMLIYDVAIRDMSAWLPPFEQKTHFGKLPVSGAIIGKDDGTGRTYGPGAFYFIRGTDSAGNPVQGREARAASLDWSESNQHIRSANLVRARITTATDFIPTSANEGPRGSQLVRSWERR